MSVKFEFSEEEYKNLVKIGERGPSCSLCKLIMFNIHHPKILRNPSEDPVVSCFAEESNT